MEKFTPLGKILHCGRQWRHWKIPPLLEIGKNYSLGQKNARTITKVFVHCKRHKRSWKTLQTLKKHENHENTLKSHEKTLENHENLENMKELWKTMRNNLKKTKKDLEIPWKPWESLKTEEKTFKNHKHHENTWTRSSSLFSWSASSAPIQEQLWPTEVLTEVNSTGAFACIQFYLIGEELVNCHVTGARLLGTVQFSRLASECFWWLTNPGQAIEARLQPPLHLHFILCGLIHQTFEWLTLKHVRFEFHILYTHYATLTELHLSIGHLSIGYIIYP